MDNVQTHFYYFLGNKKYHEIHILQFQSFKLNERSCNMIIIISGKVEQSLTFSFRAGPELAGGFDVDVP